MSLTKATYLLYISVEVDELQGQHMLQQESKTNKGMLS